MPHDAPKSSVNANSFEDVDRLANLVRQQTKHKPTIGIVCGSGLGKIATTVEKADVIPYDKLPGFPISTVPGHAGRFVIGIVEGKTVICMQGRIHPYEGYEYSACALPMRIMKLLGVQTIILTNAVGSINPDYAVGELVALKDHIFLPGLAGWSPLRGPNDEKFGPRFLTMENAYDRDLRLMIVKTAYELNIPIHQGVYVMCGGPQFETAAECKYLQQLGGDVVGMSVAHETIVSRHMGLKVAGLSLVTNKSKLQTDDSAPLTAGDVHAEVLHMGDVFADRAATLLRAIVKKL